MKFAIMCRCSNDCDKLMQSLYNGGCKWKNGEPIHSHREFHTRHVNAKGLITYIPDGDDYNQITFAIENNYQLITYGKYMNNPDIIPIWKKKPQRTITIGTAKYCESSLNFSRQRLTL